MFRHALLAIALAAVFVLPAEAQSSALGLAYQLTHTQNYDPSFSPDEKRMVYISSIEGREQLFLMNADGSHPVQLTHDDADQVFVMNADGSNVRLVANTEGRATAPKWGKQGRALYFPICRKVDFGADCQIFVAGLEPFVR